jgi:aminopeptidase N
MTTQNSSPCLAVREDQGDSLSTPYFVVGLLFRGSVLVLVLCLATITTLGIRHERLIDGWQPKHYSVTITLNEQLSEIVSARAEIDIVTLKSSSLIDLDFGDLTADSVSVNARPVAFDHRNGKLDVQLPEAVGSGTKLTITVNYHGKPKDGLVLTLDKDGKPSAVGDNWPDRVHHWIPCLDHPSAKATVTFNITAPKRDLVVANGRLDHVETRDNASHTWTYDEGVPIPPYCMIIAVGEFARFETVPALTPLSYYVPQSDSGYALKGFAPAAPALELFSQTVAPYPYEKLSLIIGATRFGGMENSSAIVFSKTLFNSHRDAQMSSAFGIPTGVENVVAHEIAHQWFGDSVTESTWADLWLSEGFATYFAGVFVQKYEGEKTFQAYMKAAAETALAYEKRNQTPIFDRDTEDLFKLLNGNNYQKGAWVLHMLRSSLGDDAFFRGIREYYNGHIGATASTEDLRAALEKSAEKNLKTFFDRWVYDSGHPQYDLTWQWQKKTGRLQLDLKQVQNGNPFLDTVPLRITTAKGEQLVSLNPARKEATMRIRINARPVKVELDPQNTLLKEASVKEKG